MGSDPSFKLNSIGGIRVDFGNRSEAFRKAFGKI